MAAQTSDPKHVDISLSQGMTIMWTDGHESHYPLEHLRANCPCATCRESKPAAAPANPFPMFKPAARLTNAESVGRYAVRLLWADGHSSGIYSFEHLRDICPCAECRKVSPKN
jgi:DUF971 family protein